MKKSNTMIIGTTTLALFVLLFFFILTSQTKSQVKPRIVPEFVGGLNIGEIHSCRLKMESFCQNLPFDKYQECIKEKMQQEPHCEQSLLFLNIASALFEKIKQYQNVDVVRAKVLAADHSSGFFIITSQGELIEPITKFDLSKAKDYKKIHHTYPNVSIWPIIIDFPKSKALPDGGIRLIFQQQLLNGCLACKKAGLAEVAYDFSHSGHFKKARLLSLIPQN